jgi:hypothetical protein
MGITVITASIPERRQLLSEAVTSVHEQTLPVATHLIRIERPPEGRMSVVHVARQLNVLLGAVDTEWVAPLGDDDLYLPHHVETVSTCLEDDVDVAYSWPLGEAESARIDVTDWPQSRLIAALEQGNFIRSTVTVRTETLRRVGGWARDYQDGGFDGTNVAFEDWDLLIRLARAGARFRCVPVETWHYRVGDWTHTLISQAIINRGFRVLEARYGNGGTSVDVTEVVTAHVEYGNWTFDVTNENLGGDPAIDQVKELSITYTVDGNTVTRSFLEGSTAQIL